MTTHEMIHEYELGGEKLRNAVKGLLPEDMHQRPVPGTWTIHEIVVHMMDSDLVGVDRMKRIIAMENPVLIGYDETAFVQKLFPADQSIDDALTVFDLTRRGFARTLRKLPPAAFERTGDHNEIGKVTLAAMLEKYVHHVDHHLRFIVDKREMLGKIMW